MSTLKSALLHEEELIPIDRSLKQQLRPNFQPAGRRFIWPLLFPIVGIATLAIIISSSPLSLTPETSFLQHAQAAYEGIAERSRAEDLIHHTATEIIQQPGSVYEQWASASGSFSLFIDRENGRKFMTIGEVSYVLPEENAQARAGQAESDRVGATDGPQYVLRTPDNVSVTQMENDPNDPTVMCVSFEYYSEEQQTIQELFQRITDWKDSEGSVDDMQDLLNTLRDPHFKDLGKVTLQTGEITQGYQLVSTYNILDRVKYTTFEMYFDPESYLLITTRMIIDNGDGNPNTTDFHNTVNEFVPASSLEASFFTPEAHGLEPIDTSGHPKNMPSYDLREGCVRQNIDAPEYLSEEEAAEVRTRIDAVRNK